MIDETLLDEGRSWIAILAQDAEGRGENPCASQSELVYMQRKAASIRAVLAELNLLEQLRPELKRLAPDAQRLDFIDGDLMVSIGGYDTHVIKRQWPGAETEELGRGGDIREAIDAAMAQESFRKHTDAMPEASAADWQTEIEQLYAKRKPDDA